jgi:hypothetical protein
MRLQLLAEIADPSVLECFAGEGKIYSACYQNYPCVGLDLKAIADGRTILHIDNRRFLRSADLSRFNVFDLDAYGSPWHQWLIILKRRIVAPGEQIAVFLTDGLRPYLAIPAGMNVPFLNKHHDFINARIVDRSTRAAGLQIVRSLVARNPRGNMRYYALILKKA